MDLNVFEKNLVKYTGGYDNYIHVTKCTRSIRINYKYHKNVDIESLKKVEGLSGVVDKDHNLQLIIGKYVNDAY